ncbi:HlyIII-domain-containing protein [Venturia nashicola]|uniref:HlyIII-domain-containing protein n=1 Tax=Venturia nashicola TaxID=86259 RepID=A0A4Z1P9Z7_9PEZI|nr:HlyIII-domain-containing protein [Venturia nashicola]
MNHQHCNEFLVSHYRPVSNSYHACLSSLCYLHNQTVNIYSHLFGIVLFVFWAHKNHNDLLTRYSTSDHGDMLAFGVFFTGVITCFVLSTTFHILSSHSQRVFHTWRLLDIYGIFIVMIATVFSATFYGFYCERFWWKVYSIGMTVVASLSAILCTDASFRSPKWKKLNAALLIGMGGYGTIPMTHAAQKWGREQVDGQMGWKFFVIGALCYVTGAFVYAMKIPERWRPGMFDLLGASHQIMHVCVILGAAVHLKGLIRAFDYNHDPATRRCM